MSPALATSKAPLHPRCAESIDYGLDASPEEEEGDLAELAVRRCRGQAARVTWSGLAHGLDPPASSTSRQPMLMRKQWCMPGCSILLESKTAWLGLAHPHVQEAARPLRHGYDHVLAEKVLKMEEKVGSISVGRSLLVDAC